MEKRPMNLIKFLTCVCGRLFVFGLGHCFYCDVIHVHRGNCEQLHRSVQSRIVEEVELPRDFNIASWVSVGNIKHSQQRVEQESMNASKKEIDLIFEKS